MNIPKIHHKKALIIILVAAAIALVVSRIDIVVIACSIVLCYNLLRHILPAEIQSSRFTVTVLAVLAYSFLLQAYCILPWVFSHNFPNTICPLLTLFTLIVCWLIFGAKTQLIFKLPPFDSSDYFALALAACIAMVIFVPPLLHAPKNQDWPVVSAISGNVDDLAHLSYLNNRITFPNGINQDYPTSWHTVSAIYTKAISPHITPGIATLQAYVIIKTISFLLLIYSLVKAAKYASTAILPEFKVRPFHLIALSMGLALFSYIFLLDIYRLGSFSVIPQLIGLVWCFVLLLHMFASKTIVPVIYDLGLALLFCIGGSLSWILLGPPLLVAAAILLLLRLRSEDHFWLQLMYISVRLLPLCLLLFGSLLTQIIALSSGSQAVSFTKSIIIDGAITVYTPNLYYILLVGCVLYFILARLYKPLVAIVYIFACMLLFSGLIYALQLTLANKLSYYFFKVLYASLILAIPLALASLMIVVERLRAKLGWHSLVAVLSVIVILIITLPGGETSFAYLKGKRWLVPSDGALMYRELATSPPQSKDETFFYSPSNGVRADIMMLLVKASSRQKGCFNTVREVIRYQQDNHGTIDPIIVAIETSCHSPVQLVTEAPVIGRAQELYLTGSRQTPLKFTAY